MALPNDGSARIGHGAMGLEGSYGAELDAPASSRPPSSAPALVSRGDARLDEVGTGTDEASTRRRIKSNACSRMS